MLLVSVVVLIKVVAIVAIVVDVASVAGLSLPLANEREELNRESLFERGAMGGSHGEGNDLKKSFE